MHCSTAVGIVLLLALGLAPDDPAASIEADRAAYRAAADVAGRDADAQVRLALWCEDRGLDPEARRHLALAVLIDPDHAAARALLGQVRRGESWKRPEEVAALVGADAEHAALRREYEGRRSRLDPTADAHWKLALWCERVGLADEATAHFAAVTRLDPRREAAWKRLGYKKHDGRWMTAEQIDAERSESEARDALEAAWRPRLEQWAAQLADPAARGEAIVALGEVEHPLLVPAVWSVLVAGRHADQQVAVQVLGQVDARDASRALATLAVFTEDAEVRRIATETLRRRDAREWADLLIGMIRKPIRYSVRPVAGPGSAGELFVEGKRYNFRRLYAAPPPPVMPIMPGDQLVIGSDGLPAVHRHAAYSYSHSGRSWGDIPTGFDPGSDERRALVDAIARGGADPQLVRQFSDAIARTNAIEFVDSAPGLPDDRTTLQRTTNVLGIRTLEIPIGRALLESHRAAAAVDQHLRHDVAAIEAHNLPIQLLNDRVLPVLEEVTGVRNGPDPEVWRAWWVNQIGLRQLLPRPPDGTSTFTDVVTAQPRPVASQVFDQLVATSQRIERRPLGSCFGKGTLVHAIDGLRAIEELQIGDLVLSQDARAGSLAYRPVVATHHNPPSRTFDVRIGGETIVSSEFHRFWVAGRGWVMALDLRVGDPIRMLGRTAEVEAIEDGQVQPVYNLDVADNRSFFVGEAGALVHDFSLPSPTIAPFDAVPDLIALRGDEQPDRSE